MNQNLTTAILVVSFGTSVNETRRLTIDAIESAVGSAFPDCAVYRAWTSRIICAKLLKRDHIKIDSVENFSSTGDAVVFVTQQTGIYAEREAAEEGVRGAESSFRPRRVPSTSAFRRPDLLFFTPESRNRQRTPLPGAGQLPPCQA